MIASMCSEPQVLEVMRIINTVLFIIKIVVPLILIITSMISFMKAITNDKDGLNESLKVFVKKAIAAIIIFFIPTFINLIVKVTSSNTDYINCLTVRTKEDINKAYETKLQKLIKEAEESNNPSDFNRVSLYLSNIKDQEKRQEYTEKVTEMRIEYFIEQAQESKSETDYNLAVQYLNELEDDEKRQEYSGKLESIKTAIENNKTSYNYSNTDYSNIDYSNISLSGNTGLGSNITPSEQLKKACNYILNQEKIMVRLTACVGKNALGDPVNNLPGGGTPYNDTWVANKAISLEDYRKGLFFGELGPAQFGGRQNLFQTHSLMYTTYFLKRTINQEYNGELTFRSGTCEQNYKETERKERYDNGAYKDVIDTTMNAVKYFILANSDGTITQSNYTTSSGIYTAMNNASLEGRDLPGMIDALKANNSFAGNYANAQIYDCRNLISPPANNTQNTTTDKDIIYAGDSRFDAYKTIKSTLGFNDSKETIYSKVGTAYDDDFKQHMSDAKNQINSNKSKTYAIAVNYGVNDKGSYKSFCDYYQGFMNDIDKKNTLYLISVNPLNESTVAYNKESNKNANVEIFNNYMKNTCVNQIKTNVPGSKVYYCDIYGSLPVSEWISRGYIKTDGIHYTTEGYKYIYSMTKSCIANNK